MLNKIRKSKYSKFIAVFLSINLLTTFVNPTTVFALTGGPSQPEVESFEPFGTSEMVDIFSGDFVYNIPLLDVGGYPINLGYHSGVRMDQEASWVGLGWNINPGSITRNMRGLPDDFDGEIIKQELNIKKNWHAGLKTSIASEVFGVHKRLLGIGVTLSAGIGVGYDNYNGVNIEQTFDASLSFPKILGSNLTGNLGVNVTSSSVDGLTLVPRAGLNYQLFKNSDVLSLNTQKSATFNSRQGLKSITSYKGFTVINGRVGNTTTTNFVNPTYIPQIQMSKNNFAFTFDSDFGITAFGIHSHARGTGYYGSSDLADRTKEIPAYGYIYSNNSNSNDNVLLDFNRENDRPFNHNTPALPLTNFTYDTYSFTGQGVGGTFRAFRNDVGYVYDNYTKDQTTNGNLGIEMGLGNNFYEGVNIQLTNVESESGRWIDDNAAAGVLKFLNKKNAIFEPYMFKKIGELVPLIGYNTVGRENPIRLKLEDTGGLDCELKSEYETTTGAPVTTFVNAVRSGRVIRSTVISAITTNEVEHGYSMDKNTIVSAYAKNKHLYEFTVLKEDGYRYIYGLPVYNTYQKEVTFNISAENSTGNDGDCRTGLVDYNLLDASIQNKNGRDNYYSSQELNPYAHSYMLTAIVSPDYVDIDGNGPSENDLGSYTKFTYGEHVDNYKWRMPYQANKANYNEGLKSDYKDQKGNYIYGEKELYYLTKIETKTHVAIFTLGDRTDALDVAGQHGGNGNKHMKKLEKISLYSKPDYDANGSSALPLKEVHFVYSNKLCLNILNSSSTDLSNNGKLTLENIYFTYGNSKKAKLNPYVFSYSNSNPDYDYKAYDRWGFYKPNAISCGNNSNQMPNAEYPYVKQDKVLADEYMSAWNLEEIDLPSGGKIKINYESDDYAYVQERKAMQMFKVVGANYTTINSLSGARTILYDNNNPYNHILVEIDQPVNNYAEFREKYLKDIFERDDGRMYGKFLVDLTSGGRKDYIKGYFKIIDDASSFSYFQDAGRNYVSIELETVEQEGGIINSTDPTNPISKTAWQFVKLNNPQLCPPVLNMNSGNITPGDFITDIWNSGILANLGQYINGINGFMKNRNYGKHFVPKKSYVRLNNPIGVKYGGGSRVSKLLVYDNWNNMAPGDQAENFAYGKEYEYKTTSENGEIISSGVASYEPLVGGDENPYKQPVFYSEELLMVPDNEHYLEEPFGESFFPSAQVGYSKVIEKNIAKSGSNPEYTTNTGYIEHQFYTAKDFPIITKRTSLNTINKKEDLNKSLIVFYKTVITDNMNVSQGYSIDINDMHGKPKMQAVYAEGKTTPNSKVEYFYKTAGKKVKNNVKIINNEGILTSSTIGVEYDLINDFRENSTRTFSPGLEQQIAGFVWPFPPAEIVIPTLFGNLFEQNLRFRSAVTTKVIKRHAILTKIRKESFGSITTQKNIAYDPKTGEVLLSSVTNNFDNPVYTLNLPAHWAYKGMQGAYKNIGSVINLTSNSNGILNTTTSRLISGDEVSVEVDNGGTPDYVRGWIWDNDYNQHVVIDEQGNPIHGKVLKVLRSGHRNLVKSMMGSVTSLVNPIVNKNGTDMIAFADPNFDYSNVTDNIKVLDANAVEYSDEWGTNTGYNYFPNGMIVNNPTPFGLEFIDFLNTLLSNDQDNDGIMDYYETDNINMDLAPYVSFANITSTVYGNITCNGVRELNYSNIISQPSNTRYFNFLCDGVKIDCYAGSSGPPSIVFGDPANNMPLSWNSTQISQFTGYTPFYYGYLGGNPANPVYTYIDYIDINGVNSQIGMLRTTCLASGEFYTTDTIYDDCLFSNCGNIGTPINPYTTGIRGNWKPKAEYAYITPRSYVLSNNSPDVDETGIYESFTPFWQFDNVSDLWQTNNSNNAWVAKATVTRHNPNGETVEERDALGNYSSAQYGYSGLFPIAVASNSRYRHIGYDGFEDYDFIQTGSCNNTHFSFLEFSNNLTTDYAHTGKLSLKLDETEVVSMIRPLTEVDPQTTDPTINPDNTTTSYILKSRDINGVFSPSSYLSDERDRTYLFSYWVKETQSDGSIDYEAISYDNHIARIYVGGTLIAEGLHNSLIMTQTDIIDGWQKKEFKFVIPQDATGCITIEFFSYESKTTYIDDVRVHPYYGNLKSYVYDNVLLRLIAELDENNFATFYEYDEEGALARVKKETERGIFTIQEVKKSLLKNDINAHDP